MNDSERYWFDWQGFLAIENILTHKQIVTLNDDIVENYNQHMHPRVLSQTRFQRWQSGLVFAPPRLQPEDLDL